MWKKYDEAQTIEEVVERNSGQAIESLLFPKSDTPIYNLSKAAKFIEELDDDVKITVIGDYDADGVNAAAILYLLFLFRGKEITVRIPKRFSEGYGLNQAILDEIDSGLIITVDNGVTAVEELTIAKKKGLSVIVLDHHLPRDDGELPPADVLVDPHVFKENKDDFDGFCGAGLAYRLACLLLEDDEKLEQLSALAAIATVADIVPLLDDNRSIVKKGFEALNSKKGPTGLNALMEHLNLFDVDEGDVGFTIGPTLNAPGRMYDDGAMKSFQMLVSTHNLDTMADNLIAINEERKSLQKQSLLTAENLITDNCLYGDSILIVCSTSTTPYPLIPEGVAGILAGQLAEKYMVPVFVLTQSKTPGELKGSGRSYGGIDIKSLMDKASDFLVAFGGHTKAAGLTVREENVEPLREFLIAQAQNIPKLSNEELYYDLLVKSDELPAVIKKINRFAPYGASISKPVILIENLQLLPKMGKHYSYMGSDSQHIKLFCGRNLSAIGFGMADKYYSYGEPMRLDMIGSIFTNKYIDSFGRYTKETQIRITDMGRAKNIQKSSRLLESVNAQLKILGGNRGYN